MGITKSEKSHIKIAKFEVENLCSKTRVNKIKVNKNKKNQKWFTQNRSTFIKYLACASFCAKNHDTGWMGGWVDGWMGGRAGFRIAYRNQKLSFQSRRMTFLSF